MFDFKTPTDIKTHARQVYYLYAIGLLLIGSVAFSHFFLDVMHQYHIDKLFHFLSGFCVYKILDPYAKKKAVLVAMVFLVGIGWEGAEYVTLNIISYYGSAHNYIIDTLGDLIADMVAPIILWLGLSD